VEVEFEDGGDITFKGQTTGYYLPYFKLEEKNEIFYSKLREDMRR